MKFLLILVVAAIFLPALQAFHFDRQPEDDTLDEWLQEQMSESQSVNEEDFGQPDFDTEDMGYATPGHVEERDFMTAFFENQDHDAFADKAEDDSYGGDSEMDDYLNDFFGSHNGATAVEEDIDASDDDGMEKYLSNFGPSDNEDANKETFDEGAAVNEDDNEDDLIDFLDDFKADAQNKPWEPTAYKETDDGTAGYVSDFFNNDPETNFQSNPVDEGAVVNEDDDFLDDFKADTQNRPNEGYNNYADFSETNQETTSQDEPVDDLELWLQTMEDHEEEAEEEDEEEKKSLLDPDFSNNFPPDDMFTFVMAQEMGQTKECQIWKKEATDAQKDVINQGKIIKEEILKLDNTIKQYEKEGKDEKTQCDLQCEKVCVPGNKGDECVEEINGTCILTQPKIDDCDQRITDPKCQAAENECKSKRKKTADLVKEINEKTEADKQKMDELTDKLKKVMEKIPPECEGAPASPSSPA